MDLNGIAALLTALAALGVFGVSIAKPRTRLWTLERLSKLRERAVVGSSAYGDLTHLEDLVTARLRASYSRSRAWILFAVAAGCGAGSLLLFLVSSSDWYYAVMVGLNIANRTIDQSQTVLNASSFVLAIAAILALVLALIFVRVTVLRQRRAASSQSE